MSRIPDVRPAARADIEHYFLYILTDSVDAAFRFIDFTELTFETIAARPGIGHPHESANTSLAGVRTLAVKGFPNHLIFYRVLDDQSVRILRIRHAAMDHDAVEMDE